jgi:hypothetical protein
VPIQITARCFFLSKTASCSRNVFTAWSIAPLPRFDAKLGANSLLGISFPFHCLFSAEINPRA